MAPESVQQVWYAAVSGDVEQLHEALEQFPDQVLLNAERKAIQVKSCGLFIAHVPVKEVHLRALNALAD